jgi:hypothetical protein
MNFDNRSLSLNDESTLMVLDRALGARWSVFSPTSNTRRRSCSPCVLARPGCEARREWGANRSNRSCERDMTVSKLSLTRDVRPWGLAALKRCHDGAIRDLPSILGMSRYAVGIAVVGTFVAATALLVYGAVEVLSSSARCSARHCTRRARHVCPAAVRHLGRQGVPRGDRAYVIAIGFYQLFFHRLRSRRGWSSRISLELELAGQVVISTLGVVSRASGDVGWAADLQGFGVATAS